MTCFYLNMRSWSYIADMLWSMYGNALIERLVSLPTDLQ